ncbi:PH domain-containing protein [Zunongwangia pacifica]|uniref:PH domain-containing protein n=1 Tax=Zunongwangia pacifica TaxID=2911062 RepID=A0A9X1ZWY9_9FLAO|nr:PH domain-containing protein [Zunongwangia pacifica]MCL6217871.1 PH domain-containing protein [Zunongwangia pacifica]
MKFKSRKDVLFLVVIFGFTAIACGIFIYQFLSENSRNQNFIFGDVLLILIAGLLLWLNFGTAYELTPHYFKYRGGPLRGEIPLEKITEIVVGKSLWLGLRPATARKGLILKYDIYNEIYISPLTNESFIKKILELDSQIKVTTTSNKK